MEYFFFQSSFVYRIALAVHVVGFVCWFAGLFYLGRLFVYHLDAQTRPDPDRNILSSQYTLMERRLWRVITWPAAIITLIAGLYLLVRVQALSQPWFHLKALLLVGLFIYHFFCGHIRRSLEEGHFKWTPKKLKMINETATVLLVAIVFTAEIRDPAQIGKAMVGVFVFVGLLVGIIKITKRVRS